MGVDVAGLLDRAIEMADACRLDEGNPGLELGLALGEAWRDGRDKVCLPDAGVFGLWVEQLIAESTGKQGKGLVPAPGVSGDGPDRQVQEVRLPDPLELGQEFFRWEFATAVAGSILGINPFDQPDVQAAKDKTNEVLAGGDVDARARGLDRRAPRRRGAARLRLHPGVRRTRPTENEARIDALAGSLGERSGCVVTHGFGPRYLHSTGQLHKGGPTTGRLPPGRRGLRRGAADPGQAVRLRPADPRAGRRRLRVAARARPPRRAHPPRGGQLMQLGMIGLGRMGGNMTTRLDRGRPRREDVRPRRRLDRRRRSRSCATSSTRRARSG